MKRVPPIQDIARIVKRTHPETVAALREYFEGGGVFNYRIAQRLARHVLQRTIPLNIAVDACEAHPLPAARAQNAQVLTALWNEGEGRTLLSYEVAPKVIGIRQDVSVRIAPTFGFVENSRASIFLLQPRRHFALSLDQLGILASIFRKTYLVDDFKDVGLELFDVSVSGRSKDRVPRRYILSDLPAVSDEAVDDCLSRFLAAYDEVTPSPRKRKPKPKLRSDVGPLFGDN